jgi:alpha-L-fucosidase
MNERNHPYLPLFLLLVILGCPLRAVGPAAATPPASQASIDQDHPLSSVSGETKEQRDARMAWWRDAKFGMFIHWGVFSVPAGWYHGKRVPGFSEWLMHDARIPVREYRSYAGQFNPQGFDAAEFVAAAKSAGMKYIVITAKHHDGFAMFDSKANDWTIVRATPYKKDSLKALAEECRKQGMKLGFYYSHAQDWNNGGAIGLSMPRHPEREKGPWDKAQYRDMDDYITKIAIPQVRELLTHYGPDTPAILWWDTPKEITRARAAKFDAMVQNVRPGLIQNNRLSNTKDPTGKKYFPGDTETPEGFIPPQGFPGRDWETCMTFNDSWGFKRGDDHWKSTRTLIRNLCDIASKGGNYLLNVGPDAQGRIPKESLDRLAQVGKWMKVNGSAIYGTSPTPFGSEAGSFSWWRRDQRTGKPLFIPDWKWRATQKPGHLSLILFQWPADGKISVPAFAHRISGASLLADPRAKLGVVQNDKGIVVSGLPSRAPDPIASVIDLKY